MQGAIITVVRVEFVRVFGGVIKKHEEQEGKKMNKFSSLYVFFESLSNVIESTTNTKIEASTLYKSYYLAISHSNEENTNVRKDFANALSLYFQDKEFEQKFIIEKPKKVRKINYSAIKENPEMPEYPVDNPGYPATPSIPIFFDVEKWNEKEREQLCKYLELGINDVNLVVKDESKHMLVTNLKSRAAWEIFLFAK